MHIPQNDYTLQELCRQIIESGSSAFEGYHLNQVKAYFYLVDSEDWLEDFASRYETEDYGAVRKLKAEYRNRSGGIENAVFYLGFYEDELLMLLTAATEEAIDQTIANTVENSHRVSPMPIVPDDFQRLNNLLLDRYEDMRITEFKSRRIPDLADAQIRPEYDRTIEYRGDDGRRTLAEFREYYGVVPVRLQYEHENIELKIDTSGKFTLKKINRESFNRLFEMVDEVVENVLEIQEITQDIRFEKEEVRSGNLSITVPKISAGQIKFDKNFNLLMAEEFVQSTEKRDEMPFTFTDVTMQAGSLDLSAKVSDESRNAHFNISATENSMTIIPKHNCSFPSLIQFYLCFAQSVDESAKMMLKEDIAVA